MTTQIKAAAQQTVRPNQDKETTRLKEQIRQLQAETEKLKGELAYWRAAAKYFFYN